MNTRLGKYSLLSVLLTLFVWIHLAAQTNGPVIEMFTPNSGTTGTKITINGQNFTGTNAVTIGGVPAKKFKVISANKIIAYVSANAATGKVSVTTPNGERSLGGFTFKK